MMDGKLKMTNEKRRSLFVISFLSFIIFSLCLRLVPLGRYVTPDEPMWVYRSVRFVDALSARDWAAVPSTGHPGVTTMWLGAAGVTVRRLIDPVNSAAHLDWIRSLVWVAPENPEAFRHLAFFLPFGQVAVALVTTLGLVVAYALLRRPFGRPVATLGTGLLALEPFLIGHSGLLHTDALLSTFCVLALLAALNGLRGERPVRWWALAGLFTGMALLTKTPALILPPFLLLLLATRSLQPSKQSLQSMFYSSLVFCLTAALTYVALYPALWADPLAVWRTLTGFATQHAESVLRPTFFLGTNTFDPGAAFYPLVLLFRASPVVLVGLVVGATRLFRLPADRRLAFLALLLFALLFGLAMSQGAKKHDRYLLPVFPPLAVAAALALAPGGAGNPEGPSHRRPRMRVFLPIALQFLLLLPFLAYPLMYYNPVAGGPWVARQVLPVGWGEQAGDAARWLNCFPDADQLTVAAAYVPSFSSIFAGRTVVSDQADQADYVVRLLPQDGQAMTFSAYQQPIYTATLGFVDQAVVLANTAPAEQSAYLAARAQPDDLIVLDADLPLLRRYDGPGALVSTASLIDEESVAEWLAEELTDQAAIWLVSSPSASPVTTSHVRGQLEALSERVDSATVAGVTISRFVSRAESVTTDVRPFRAVFAGQLALVDGAIPETTMPDELWFTLRWYAPVAPGTDYRTVFTLRDDLGRVWSITDRPVLNGVDFPTSAWIAGTWADRSYVLPLPPGIPPDDYVVEVALYDGATGAGQGATAPDGAFLGTRVPVARVSVLPPATQPPFDAGESDAMGLAAGSLTLLALDPPPAEVLSGDSVDFSLFWRADAAPQTDYRVRLRLVDAVGEVRASSTAALSPYPTSAWHAGDWFESRYCVPVEPMLPPGEYQLTLAALDAAGRVLWEDDQILDRVVIAARARTLELPADIAYPIDIPFGDVVRLRGFDIVSAQVAPGEGLPLTLVWQAEGPAEQDVTLFVHLLGADGQSVGQVDRVPGGGMSPATSWAPGQVIVEDVTVPVAAGAPAGTYHLAVGFYDPAYGHRLAPLGENDVPLPGEQFLLPIDIVVGE
jgi:4-amino-4-deoxy-L-arabinose transferase-like glycosyltransferase